MRGDGVCLSLPRFRLRPRPAHGAFRVEGVALKGGAAVGAFLRLEGSQIGFRLLDGSAVLPAGTAGERDVIAAEIDRLFAVGAVGGFVLKRFDDGVFEGVAASFFSERGFERRNLTGRVEARPVLAPYQYRDTTLEGLQDFRLARWDSNPLPFVEHGAIGL